jgi:hypothetical protein
MRTPLVTTASDFVVQTTSSSSSLLSTSNTVNPTANAASSTSSPSQPIRHVHASPAFLLPSHPSPKLPYLYQPSQAFFKKTADRIGYACHAQHSENMNLSLQWDKEGKIRQWEKEKPFAVRDERERQARRSRGEKEEEKVQLDLFKPFPPVINPVPAPAAFSLDINHPLLPPQPSSAPASLTLSSRAASNAAIRVQARRLLQEGERYDPYASSTLPFFTPSPSRYTEIFTSPPSPSSCSSSSLKVSLTSHPASAYSIRTSSSSSPSSAYHGKNNRWTEERLFFRGYSNSQEDTEAWQRTERSGGVDLLFDAPLYSSFALDGVYREPKRAKQGKKVRWSRLEAPRMNKREDAVKEVKDDDNSAGKVGDGAGGTQSGDDGDRGANGGIDKTEVRLSGVFVPRAGLGRFIATSSYPLCNPNRD